MFDQMCKLFVVEISGIYDLEKGVDFVKNLLSIRLEKNTGIAFGINMHPAAIIVLVILLILAGIYMANMYLDLGKGWARFLVALVLGGALGNLVGRIAHGYVVDFIVIWKWPVFNIADMFITIGIFSIIIFYGRLKKI